MPRGRKKKTKPVQEPVSQESAPETKPQEAQEPLNQHLSTGWSREDPVIQPSERERKWIAVYRCAEGHKTKATNEQADSGVVCSTCGKAAEILPQFRVNPEL